MNYYMIDSDGKLFEDCSVQIRVKHVYNEAFSWNEIKFMTSKVHLYIKI